MHGLLGVALVDYIRNLWLIKTLNYYTKVAIGLYIVDCLIRTAIYLKILGMLNDVEIEGEIQDFGGFLAIYIENDAGSLAVTIILLCVYCTCFLSTFYILCLTGRLEKEVREVNAAK